MRALQCVDRPLRLDNVDDYDIQVRRQLDSIFHNCPPDVLILAESCDLTFTETCLATFSQAPEACIHDIIGASSVFPALASELDRLGLF